jgi:hypothetical protein
MTTKREKALTNENIEEPEVRRMTCDAVSLWQWVAGGFAILSALLWIAASLFKTPPPPITYETLNEIAAALKKQGRFNATAAFAAAIAAAVQSYLILAPSCIHLN